MSDLLAPAKKKKNTTKSGRAAENKARKRLEALERQTSYSKKDLKEKIALAGKKQLAKLTKEKPT